MSDEERNKLPRKVGKVIEEGGVRRQVVAVRRTGGGAWGEGAWMIETSAEPLAAEKGYLTLNQVLGFKVQHMPPPSPPEGGTLRDPAKLKAVDWDFNAVMKEPLEVRKLALVHELARECAAMREACRIYHVGRAEADERNEKVKAANVALCDAEDEVKRLKNALMAAEARGAADEINSAKETLEAARERARLATCGESFVVVTSGNGAARQEWMQAEAFLGSFLMRLPFDARGVLPELIAEDVPWVRVGADDRKKLLGDVKKAQKKQGVRKSRTHKDMEADGPGWPFNDPIEFARKWDEETGRPEYSFNDGRPGRMILAERHDNAHGLPILSEALNLCVCLNFSDEEIMAQFAKWLKWRRANLHDDLAAFRAAGGSRNRLDEVTVNPSFKALAALRLCARFGNKEAAYKFREIYKASEKRTGKKDPSEAPTTQVAGLVAKAVELGAEFLPECPLDSAVNRIEL
jgi:hypothetical protein